MRVIRSFLLSTSLAALSFGTACGPGRTVAATQTTPATFESAKSDAKAIEIIDALVAACGGEAAWSAAHEVRFTVKMKSDGTEVLNVTHIWDKWNGKHHFTNTSSSGQVTSTVYEIYGSMAFGLAGKNEVPRADVKEWVPAAKSRLWIDSYMLFMVFKLKDPGVTLKHDGERSKPEAPEVAAYDVIKATFDAGVASAAGDVYHVVIDKSTKLVAWVEWTPAGKPDEYRIAYRWDDWQDVGGVKLAMKRVNLGHEGEVVEFSAVELRKEPEEELYIKVLK